LHAYERSLVSKYDGQPFVVLGVNLDPDRDVLRRVEEREQFGWRSWWDGDKYRIAQRWNVEQLPRVFLLDRKGVIRLVSQGPPEPAELEKKIDELLKESP
jgi:hypothetical protein